MSANGKTRLNYAQTFSIGFGMFAISAAWALYNAYVPIKLKDMMLPTALVGVIMGIDNFCGFTIQPFFGLISDKVRTRWGRRMPFALFAIPVAAVCLMLIAIAPTAPLTVIAIILYAVLMSACRAPIVALMPDVTDSHVRSQANGIINFMGAVGNVIALLAGSYLYKHYGMGPAFISGSIIMVAALFALNFLVKEPDDFRTKPGEPARIPFVSWKELRQAVIPKLDLDEEARRSFVLILAVLFLYTFGGNAVETYFSLFAVHDLGMEAAVAGGSLVWYAIGAMASDIPAGWIGTKFGRRNTMSVGLILAILMFVPMPWIASASLVPMLAFGYGFLWTLVYVNAFPWIAELGGRENTGAMTAYYYLATAFAASVSPAVFGLIQQAAGTYKWMFIYAAVFFAFALCCMPFITRGEAEERSM
ncbi:MFS transporter [Bifidobacterium olomucense]|uniref:MFS transporter n=1 Tax=Bifidobacterium olomucense TaxID=2675324 RepID=A0A7Y0EWV0_9BIFI|nr:MFS transporter [Bifidobacterium sp. DSM 109959]NMM97883.1 MFS transporter [Bifidobacterium sp. DSM 109959]